MLTQMCQLVEILGVKKMNFADEMNEYLAINKYYDNECKKIQGYLDFSDEFKKTNIKHKRESQKEEIEDLKKRVIKKIDDIQAETEKPYEHKAGMQESVEFMKSFKKSEMLTPEIMEQEINKFAGNEKRLLHYRQMLKDNGLDYESVDEHLQGTIHYRNVGDLEQSERYIQPSELTDEILANFGEVTSQRIW